MGNLDEKPFTEPCDLPQHTQKPSFYPVPPRYYIDALRAYLRDWRMQNLLYDLKYEHTDEQLAEAWGRAALNYIESPPTIPIDGTSGNCFSSLPRYTLMLKATAEAITSLAWQLMRNETSYQDGDQSFSINHQWKSLVQQANQLNAEYNQERMRQKAELNANLVYMGVHSEFGNYFQDLSGQGGLQGAPLSNGNI